MKYKNYIKVTIVALAAAFAVASCSGRAADATAAADSNIAVAEEAIEEGDFTEGAKVCQRLMADTATLNVSQLCRMAIVYAHLADNDVDAEASMASAVQCLATAYSRDAAATDAYLDALPVASQPAARMVLQLLHSPADSIIIADHEEDLADTVAVDHYL